MSPDESKSDESATEAPAVPSTPALAPSSDETVALAAEAPEQVSHVGEPVSEGAPGAISGATLVGVTPPISVQQLRALAAGRSAETAAVRPNVTQLGRRAAWEIRRHASNDNQPSLSEPAKTIPVAPTLPVVWKEGRRVLEEREASATRRTKVEKKPRKGAWREQSIFLMSVVGGCIIGVGIAVFGLVVIRRNANPDEASQPAASSPKQALTVPAASADPAAAKVAPAEKPEDGVTKEAGLAASSRSPEREERAAMPRPRAGEVSTPETSLTDSAQAESAKPVSFAARRPGDVGRRDDTPTSGADEIRVNGDTAPPAFLPEAAPAKSDVLGASDDPTNSEGRGSARAARPPVNGIAKSSGKKPDAPNVDPDAVLPLSLD